MNFLDDVALMRRAQSDVLVQLSGSIRKQENQWFKSPLAEVDSEEESDGSDSASSFDYVQESLTNTSENEVEPDAEATEVTEDESDDDTADSVDIVETTLNNAVEKTVATFAPLLHENLFSDRSVRYVLVLELPLRIRLSAVKLFYDTHLTSLIPSVVVTNAAGIELLTIVPSSAGGAFMAELQDEPNGHGIVFSRYDLDKEYGFGRGGLPMSVLGSDEGADKDSNIRIRARLDDIELGEVEVPAFGIGTSQFVTFLPRKLRRLILTFTL